MVLAATINQDDFMFAISQLTNGAQGVLNMIRFVQGGNNDGQFHPGKYLAECAAATGTMARGTAETMICNYNRFSCQCMKVQLA